MGEIRTLWSGRVFVLQDVKTASNIVCKSNLENQIVKDCAQIFDDYFEIKRI